MRNYSTHAKQQQRLLSPTDQWVVLLEVSHAALAQPVRMVVDSQEIVSNGNTYLPVAAQIEFPEDQDTQYPKARISIDNVGRSLMRILEDTYGLRGAKMKLLQIYRSRPDVIEQSITLEMKDITVTQTTVSASLSFDNVFDAPSTPLTYRPSTKVGLL